MARGNGLYVPGSIENLQNVEVLNLGANKGSAGTPGDNQTTFGPVHFMKELRVSSFSKHQQLDVRPKLVELDD